MSSNPDYSNQALIFIPDISGYTQFVNSTEIQHSRHILKELLEVVLDANEIGLELSEIEGDALLLYRKGKAPTCQELLAQVQKMFMSFHKHLKKYETQRICSCGACCSANQLNLKFVAHYGEMVENIVNDRSVLFGKEVVKAHRLLKNKVDSDEYSLFSSELLSACPSWRNLPEMAWSEISHLEEEYDFGSAKYSYLDLNDLAKLVPEPTVEDYSVPRATQMVFDSEGVIEVPIGLAFNVVSDYYFRADFFEGQHGNDMQNHQVFQNGSRHRCLVGKKENDPVIMANNFTFDENKITFVESNQRDDVSTVWTLLAIGKGVTRVRMTIFVVPNFFRILLFKLFMKKKLAKDMQKTWRNLEAYCKKLIAENKRHSSEVVLPEGVMNVGGEE